MTATPPIESIFHALSNPTRVAVIERLGHGPATVSELAAPFAMALPSFVQHLKILEDCGLILTEKRGRSRIVRVQKKRLGRVADWLDQQRHIWERRLDQLDDYLSRMPEE